MQKQTQIVPVYYNNLPIADTTLEIISYQPNVWVTDGLAASRMIQTLIRLGYQRPTGYEVLVDKVRFVSPRTR
jgi:hypothetical protein